MGLVVLETCYKQRYEGVTRIEYDEKRIDDLRLPHNGH